MAETLAAEEASNGTGAKRTQSTAGLASSQPVPPYRQGKREIGAAAAVEDQVPVMPWGQMQQATRQIGQGGEGSCDDEKDDGGC